MSISDPNAIHSPPDADTRGADHFTRLPDRRTAQTQWHNPFQDSPHPQAHPRLSQLPLGPTEIQSHSPDPARSFQSITQPQNAYIGESTRRSAFRRNVSFSDAPPGVREFDSESMTHGEHDINAERALKRRGIHPQIYADPPPHFPDHDTESIRHHSSEDHHAYSSARLNFRRLDSIASLGSDYHVDHEDMGDHDDAEDGDKSKSDLGKMNYRARRKHLMRVRIEFNVTSMENRQEFLIRLARALMTFGAPSHRIESQLVAAARILEVEAEFIHLPGVIICSFGDQDLGHSETHFVKCGGRLSLGALHKVHLVYRAVVHDEISAKQATDEIQVLLDAPAVYPVIVRCILAFLLSALICPLAFGGSFLDLWIAGFSAFVLAVLQLYAAAKSALYANVFEITVAIFVSFAARGLSAIRTRIFCYTAISSSGIIGILPGYLILSSSLELASKNIVCGSVKMVYALIYTLFLGFGLQIGSDFYLLFDRKMREELDTLAATLANAVTLSGSWLADNTTQNSTLPIVGTWTFTRSLPVKDHDLLDGCYRPTRFPWFLQPFPTWTSFLIVPTFSFLSSLANLQPIRSKQLPVMVIISCCSYASNKIANSYIFNRSDVVSAIGAFTVGVLGNVYSRKMGGTAFTSMVTGVLFLVPSGLSQAGGITANGNGIDIGGAMIAVTIGITVGLFMSQALVYMFGTRKNAAVFSF